MKRALPVFLLCFCLCVSLCGCRGGYTEGDAERRLRAAMLACDGLPAVSFYSSLSEEGEPGYYDPALPSVLLGQGDASSSLPSGCRELSFFLASGMRVCEGWAAVCYTVGEAEAVSELFSARAEILSRVDFESDDDLRAAQNARLVRRGRTVYFFAVPDPDLFSDRLGI